jgi:hypothetical protein
LADGADPDLKNAAWIGYGAGGTDYSQQAAAQVSAADICIVDGATTEIYRSGATKWADDYVNNVIHLTAGTGFTAGWYHITAIDANDDAVLDRSAGAAESVNGTGAVGGAFLLGGSLDQEVLQAVQAGNRIWLSGANADPGSTYTMGEAVAGGTSTVGTVTSPIRLSGYMAGRGDDCAGTKMPLLNSAAYNCTWPGYWIIKNLRSSNTTANGFQLLSGYTKCENCWFDNSSGTAGRYAVYDASGHSTFVGCQMSSAKGIACGGSTGSRLVHCYLHDSDRGLVAGGSTVSIIDCVFDSCLVAAGSYGYGIDAATTNDHTLVGNVFYNCTCGLHGTTTAHLLVLGNIFSSCVDGVLCTTATLSNLYDYNIWWNSIAGEDIHGFSQLKGPHDITADPLLHDPANGDFTLDAGSPALNALNLSGTRNGMVGSYKWNIGVDQDDNAAAGGGGGSIFGSVVK